MIKKTALVLTVFASLTMQAQNLKEYWIKESTAPCVGVAPMDCMQVRKEGNTQWENFYSTIAGFDYEPGYRYRLLVQETPIPLEQVPADASSIRYELQSLVSKIKVDSQYQGMYDYITRNNWKLIQMNGDHQRDYTQTLRLNMDALTLSGSAGCNSYAGSFMLDPKAGSCAIAFVMRTEMACDALDLETEFLNTLENKIFRFDVADQTLNFYEDNQLVLMFAISNEA